MQGWIKQILKESLWVPPAAAAIFSVTMAWLAYAFGADIEGKFDFAIGEDSLVSLLSVFATGMLTVSTFTVSAIIAAATGVARNATPRASQFILADVRSQLVLSSFIAAFIYSIGSILALKAVNYTDAGRFLLFVGLVAIVVVVLIAFIQWVDGVLKLGRQQTVLDKLAANARRSLGAEVSGLLGAKAWDGKVPRGWREVMPDGNGYVSGIGVDQLQEVAVEADVEIILALRPGDPVDPTRPIAYVKVNDKLRSEIEEKVTAQVFLFRMHNEETDLRFNLRNLAEMADRALSPGINDPGTANIVLDIIRDVLCEWNCERGKDAFEEVRCDRIQLPHIDIPEVFDTCFVPIARDGAGMIEVASKLQTVLGSLIRLKERDFTRQAKRVSRMALEYSNSAMVASTHMKHLEALASAVQK